MIRFFLFQISVIVILNTVITAQTNAGYTAKIEGPTIIRDPVIGQTIDIPIFLDKVTEAKGGLI